MNSKTGLFLIIAVGVIISFFWINKEKERLEAPKLEAPKLETKVKDAASAQPAPGKTAETSAAAVIALAPAPVTPTPDRGKKVFMKKCKICHTWGQNDKHKIGPNLWGVAGAGLGAKAGYRYSKPFKNAKGAWDGQTLDAFIANPRKFIKGTKMVFRGLKKAADRAAVIAFLRTLKEQGAGK
ncbi:MAG TPA: c-type cytochrome [Rhodospirillales bacterium]|nr:c-type cytochrome [Rhodospirillales bacterium]